MTHIDHSRHLAQLPRVRFASNKDCPAPEKSKIAAVELELLPGHALS
jgi:hypothetical protein